MIGIKNTGVYIPENKISNLTKLEKFDIDKEFVIDKIGVEQIAVKETEEDISSMCVEAFKNLLDKEEITLGKVKLVVLITQNPESNIPHSSALIHDKLNLPSDCACFDVSLGCSGYVYGLSIVKSFMESNGLRDALLFTCDPYSKIMDYEDKNTSLLFGDAATVTYLSTDSPKFEIGKFTFGTIGKESHNLTAGVNGSSLFMNGRGIYNFVVRNIPKDMNRLLEINDLKENDIDVYLFHQGSKYMLEALAKRMNLDPNKVVFGATNYGNTVSSSIPILFNDLLKIDEEKKQTLALSGFGVGLSWSSVILKKIN